MGCGASSEVKYQAPDEPPEKPTGDPPSGKGQMENAPLPKIVKVLLLGAGETGKSTIMKQLRLQYGQRNEMDMASFKQWLMRNAVLSAQALIGIADNLGLGVDEVAKVTVSNIDLDSRPSAAEIGHIVDLWRGGPLREAWEHNAATPQHWCLDQTPYYLDNVEQFCKDGYEPSDDDILRARSLTTGINTVEFVDDINAQYLMSYMPLADAAKIIASHNIEHVTDLKWQVIDVGGQRGERRKWLHCLDDILALVWTAGLIEYKQVMYEEPERIRMVESIDLFSKWANAKQFKKMPIMLIFTKRDVFEDTYDEAALKKIFPQFKGSGIDEALDFIQQEFKSKIEDQGQLNSISMFVLDTTNPEDFHDMLDALRSLVARHNADFIASAVQQAAEAAALLKKPAPRKTLISGAKA